ncbi:protein transport protein S31, partial [Dispira parvispora]
MTLQDDDAPKEADARDPFADENAEASTAAPTEGAEFFAQAAAAGPAVTDQSTVGPTFLHQPLTLGLEADDLNALITRTILMGDFDDAVDVCLKHERYADALILASCGGADLLARTQQLYFEAKGDNLPYIRLLHGIVGGDLSDVVESSNIQEWDKVLVLLCTYAQGDQFSNLCEKLGERLESTWQTQSPGNTNSQLLQSAVVCYLAAGSLDRVVRIWIYLQKMGLDVNVQQGKIQSADNPSVQATALQHLVEKVSVFRKAVDFIDTAVETPLGSAVPTHADKPLTEATPRNFTLGVLYDLYCDYAQWLLTQGQTTIAA